MTPSSRAARISLKVWRFTDVGRGSGSGGGPISMRRSGRRLLLTTVTAVPGRPLVATQSSYRSGGRQARSAGPASICSR